MKLTQCVRLALILVMLCSAPASVVRAAQPQQSAQLPHFASNPTITAKLSPPAQRLAVTSVFTGTRLLATNSFGGTSFTLAGEGNRLYYAAGADLVAADISTPSNPVELGRLTAPGRTRYYSITAANAMVYAPHGASGVDIIDFTDPAQPTPVGAIPLNPASFASVNALVVSGTVAYVLQGNLLRVVDVSLPTTPTETVYMTPTATTLSDLVVVGNYAYVAAGSAGLVILDVTSAITPAVVGTLGLPGNTLGVVKQGNYAYVVTQNSLRVVDVSTPGTPVLVGTYLPGGTFDSFGDIALSGNMAYVLDRQGQALHVVNVSTVTNPVAASVFPLLTTFAGLFVSGSTLYVGTYSDGLAVVNATNPNAPFLIKTVAALPYAQTVASFGNAALVASFRTLWLMVLNGTSVAATPIFTATKYIGAVAVQGNIAYVAETEENSGISVLQTLNLSNPLTPIALGSVVLSLSYVDLVVVTGTYAYVGSNQGVSAVNVANLSVPQEMSVVPVPSGFMNGLALSGNKLYWATSDGLLIYSIATPGTMTYLGQYSAVNGRDVATDGRYAYVPDGNIQGVRVIDVLTPTAPVLIKTLQACGAGGFVALSAGYLHLTNGCQFIQLYDVRNPVDGQLFSVGSAGLSSYGLDVEASARVWVADGPGGFIVLDRFDFSMDSIPTSGGTLVAPNGLVTVTVPANTFTDTVVVEYQAQPAEDTAPLVGTGDFFEIAFYDAVTFNQVAIAAGSPFTVTLAYAPSSLRKDTLRLYRQDGPDWTQAGITNAVNLGSQQVTAYFSSELATSLFALLGETYSVFLPAVLR